MSSLKRRLAAIVFTDIIGFTDLSAHDEEGAYKLVKKQREILKPIVSTHEGEWLKEEGDRFYLAFSVRKRLLIAPSRFKKQPKFPYYDKQKKVNYSLNSKPVFHK